MWETKTEAMVLFCKINSVKWFCSIFATLDEKGSGIRCVQQLPAASRLVQVIAALPCGWGGGVDTSVNSLKEGNGVKHISPLVGLLFRAFWRTINEPLCSPNMCSLGGGGGGFAAFFTGMLLPGGLPRNIDGRGEGCQSGHKCGENGTSPG